MLLRQSASSGQYPSMDLNSTGRRSASQGSLHNVYRDHMRPTGRMVQHQQSPRSLPGRMKENATLLPSPGPLESMLKTTTETGDIGIFSISPVPPSSAIQSALVQASPTRDAFLRSPAQVWIAKHSSSRDDRKRLPSYRDTTSEILSLYGSDTQPSFSRSVSSSLDDAPRSYSMTTSSTRYVPSQKSSATLQSSQDGTVLQRSRSPFPYPTRLKRPGTRPSSPALTEGGVIDYSRMVEIDRTSQRTTNGHRKIWRANAMNQAPPLSLRRDGHRSTNSLPSRTSPSGHHPRTYTPRAWTPGENFRSHCRSVPTERSAGRFAGHGSSTMVEVVDPYGTAQALRTRPQPVQASAPFYYDYSEAFEQVTPTMHNQETPLCPVPQRAGSINRAKVLSEDSQAELETATDDVPHNEDRDAEDGPTNKIRATPDAQSDTSFEHLPLALGPSYTEDTNMEKLAQHELVSCAIPYAENVTCTMLASRMAETPVSVQNSTGEHHCDENAQSSAATNDRVSATVAKGWGHHIDNFSRGDLLDDESPQRPASPSDLEEFRRLNQNIQPLELSSMPVVCPLAETSSRQGQPGYLKRPPSLNINEVTSLAAHQVQNEATNAASYETDQTQPDMSHKILPGCSLAKAGENSDPQIRKHRRNVATTQIDIQSVQGSDYFKQRASSIHDYLGSLSQTASGNEERREDAWSPQVMKALPLLPPEAHRSSCPHCAVSSPKHRPDVTGPPTAIPMQGVRTCLENQHPVGQQAIQSSASPRARRIKMRHRHHPSSQGDSCFGDNVSGSDLIEDSDHRPRLKLKVSRRAINGIVPANPDVTGSSPSHVGKLSRDLSSNSWYGIFDHLERPERQHERLTSESDELQTTLRCTLPRARTNSASQRSDQFNIPYPPSPSGSRRSTMFSKVYDERPKPSSSVYSPVRAQGRRMLKEKLSVFRLKKPQSNVQNPSSSYHNFAADLNHGELGASASVRNSHGPKTPAASRGASQRSASRQRKKTNRMRKWAKEARRALRSYVKKALDDHP